MTSRQTKSSDTGRRTLLKLRSMLWSGSLLVSRPAGEDANEDLRRMNRRRQGYRESVCYRDSGRLLQVVTKAPSSLMWDDGPEISALKAAVRALREREKEEQQGLE